MDWLNYHHLLYFWVVAREGSISRACDQLHLAQPTISSQLRKLERAGGGKLFKQVGRNLVLTEQGQIVFRYADEIFSLGRELMDVLQGRPTGSPVRFLVGIPDVLPKLVAYRLLEPALRLPEPIRLICTESSLNHLLTELASHRLDIVLSESPLPPSANLRVYNHLLGESSVSIFGTTNLAKQFCRKFPQSLNGAPFLMPSQKTTLRRSLEQWFDSQSIRPVVKGDFEDSALLKVFGQAGHGLFPAPTVIETEVRRQYGVRLIGRLETVCERYYAISVERKLKHPAVVAISEAAQQKLFG